MTFGTLYVFVVLSLARRRLLHVNVTAHPHAAWTAQQIVEAVGPDAHVLRLIRDAAVATIPLSAFYSDGTDHGVIRLSFSKDDATLLEAARRLCLVSESR